MSNYCLPRIQGKLMPMTGVISGVVAPKDKTKSNPLARMYRSFKMITNTYYNSSWKSKGLSSESIKPPTKSDNSLTPALNYYSTKTRVKFIGSCLKQSKISYNHGKVVNIYIVYEL